MRDMTDLIGYTKFISKRCFDKILIYIDVNTPEMSFDQVFGLMLHQFEFMKHVFGDDIVENVGVYFQNSTELRREMISELKTVSLENAPVRSLDFFT